MKIQELDITEIIPYANNPRNNAAAIDAVAASIREFGFKVPVVIDKNNILITGHTRLEAAKKLGLEKIPAIRAADLTEAQVKAFRLADNKVAEIATWDDSLLAGELQALDDLDFDMADFGFPDDELGDDIDGIEDPEVPEDPDPVTQPGDIFRLGPHRLMCGDCTHPEDMARLIGAREIDLLLTDPPYNVDYDGNGTREKIQNDNFNSDEEAGEKLWLPAFMNLYNFAKDKCAYYLTMPQGGTHMMMMMMMMMKAGWQVKHELIWRKQSLVLGRQDYNYQHEPISYGWKKSHNFVGKGKFATTSVWEFDRPTASKEHPTMKPVDLVAECMLDNSLEGFIVLDLFGGSGTTLIAAEQLGRKCYMMELDPHYCDVIRKRWAEFVHGEGCDWQALTPKTK